MEIVEKATYWLWEHQKGSPLVSSFSNILHCYWAFKGPPNQKHSQRGSPRHKWIGWGDCYIDCQMDTSLGQSQKYYEIGLLCKSMESSKYAFGGKNKNFGLWLSGRPFVSSGWWNVVILSCYHMRMPEMYQMCFLLMFPNPQSVFIMPPSCPKLLRQQHTSHTGKGWDYKVKIQTFNCVAYSKHRHFSYAMLAQVRQANNWNIKLSVPFMEFTTIKGKVSQT